MAGVKGRSGGPRKNSGGKRPGAGRPRKNAPAQKAKAKAQRPSKPALPEFTPEQESALGAMLPPGPDAQPEPPPPTCGEGVKDAKVFLEGVMSGAIMANDAQLKAAQYLLPFQHRKLGETGKKEQKKDDAGKVARRFAPAPPRLATSGGKPVA